MADPKAMPYRSMGVNGWKPLDMPLVELAAELEFNDLQLTMAGSHFDLYFDVRTRATENRLFEIAKDFGMSTTLWIREFYNENCRWGLPELSNDEYWSGIHRRYAGLAALFPELDNFILTLVESDKWVAVFPPEAIAKTVETIIAAIKPFGKELIFRTFSWHPELARNISNALPAIPEDVLVSTKVVGNDWNYRQADHFLIGDVLGRRQVVEMNLFGTWQREHYVANAYTDEIRRRFDHWEQQGVYGVFVPPDGRTVQSRPIGNGQEMNLWAMGRLAAGERDLDAVWRRFAVKRFGEKAADTMVEVLKPTGRVLDEALHVDREFFGHPESGIPCLREMMGRTAKKFSDEEAESVPDDLEKFTFNTIPFAINFCTWRWDPSYVPTYHRIRKGDPGIIEEKVKRVDDARALAQESLEKLETVKDDLPAGGYEYTRFKLEENAYHLELMTEAELAWLRASSLLYFDHDEAERTSILEEIEGHLHRLEELAKRKESEHLTVEWQGIRHDVARGEYINPIGYVDEFRRYWGIGQSKGRVDQREYTVDTRYGPIKVYEVEGTKYADWVPVAKKWDLSDRLVIWTINRELTPKDQPVIYGG